MAAHWVLVLGRDRMDATQRAKLTALIAQQHLGVIVTHGEEWPTATLQAFAETPDLDLLFIMVVSAEKLQNLRRRPKVTVLIDSRHNIDASTLEIARASIQGVADEVALKSPEGEALKAL